MGGPVYLLIKSTIQEIFRLVVVNRETIYFIYRTFLREPRMPFGRASKECYVSRNTLSRHWYDALRKGIFFPPQLRLKMYKGEKEYIYLVQNDLAHEMYENFKKNHNVLYMCYCLGKIDLLIQTDEPLKEIPENTLFFGNRGNYIFPETKNYGFNTCLKNIKNLLDQEHEKSKVPVLYIEKPDIKGSNYGEMIFPYVKYDLKTNYTFIVKKLGISFASFYKGLDYLMNVSTVLLPFYPLGIMQYSQHFFVFWSEYEELLCELFGYFPCHVSLVKVNDALLVYAPSILPIEFPLFTTFHKMLKMGLIDRFWTTDPLYHWKPDI